MLLCDENSRICYKYEFNYGKIVSKVNNYVVGRYH